MAASFLTTTMFWRGLSYYSRRTAPNCSCPDSRLSLHDKSQKVMSVTLADNTWQEPVLMFLRTIFSDNCIDNLVSWRHYLDP